MNRDSQRKHILTIALEDYFHVGTLNQIIRRGQWTRFEPRLQSNTRKALDLLDAFNIHATFFVVGWVADRYPELIREVAERGHEIANHGYLNRSLGQMSRQEFREDILRSRESLERAARTPVIGYRVAHELFFPSDLWALEVLAKEGFQYDSSISPIFRRYAQEPWRQFTHQLSFDGRTLWEFPLSSLSFLRWHIPIAGGNYFRQFPHALMKRGVEYWHRHYSHPFVMYFHVWELDEDLPKISGISRLSRIRHYRNVGDRMERILRDYFERYSFASVADYLSETAPKLEKRVLQFEVPEAGSGKAKRVLEIPKPAGSVALSRIPVTIVVPCYNEEQIIPYLANTLKGVTESLKQRYELRFVFVDDGSTDKTSDMLSQVIAPYFNCRVIRHSRNQGVAAAILTGIRQANTAIVCSMDCDCTYDPLELGNMIPLLVDGVDLVTASPYHPQGQVRNVKRWRLSLSQASSFLYRLVLRQKLFTYTSCFRVYRRSKIVPIKISDTGFPGVAEILARLDLAGSKIVEYPAVLEARLLGRSKMKITKQILRHLRILLSVLGWRMFGELSPADARIAETPNDNHDDATPSGEEEIVAQSSSRTGKA